MAVAVKQEVYENRFWLRVMLDHLFIILDALNYREKEEIAAAHNLIKTFNLLLQRAWDPLDDAQMRQLDQDAFNAAQEIRKYKLHILSRQLTGKISISITSGLVSRLVNEAEAYLEILAVFLQNKEYIIEPVPLHLLWLMDAAGHAEDIAKGFNFSNADLKTKTLSYQKEFLDLYIRAAEMKGFFRIGVKDFPSFDQLNTDVNERMTEFTEFFVAINSKIIGGKVMSTVSPLMLDHMYREECYYLMQLSKVSEIKPPVCDPTVQAFELPK